MQLPWKTYLRILLLLLFAAIPTYLYFSHKPSPPPVVRTPETAPSASAITFREIFESFEQAHQSHTEAEFLSWRAEQLEELRGTRVSWKAIFRFALELQEEEITRYVLFLNVKPGSQNQRIKLFVTRQQYQNTFTRRPNTPISFSGVIGNVYYHPTEEERQENLPAEIFTVVLHDIKLQEGVDD